MDACHIQSWSFSPSFIWTVTKNIKRKKKKRGKESREEGRMEGRERKRVIAHCYHKWKGSKTVSGDNLSGTFLHVNSPPDTSSSFGTCPFSSCSLLAELKLSARKAPAEGGQKGCEAANFSISPLGLCFSILWFALIQNEKVKTCRGRWHQPLSLCD